MKKFLKINIGEYIHNRANELEIEPKRICNFLNCNENDLSNYYNSTSLDSDLILQFSKILEYDFFRLYSHHLIIHSPSNPNSITKTEAKQTNLPQFRKNLYTKEIIDFILELISTKEKTIHQITDEFKIPKTTIYKWINKYKM